MCSRKSILLATFSISISGCSGNSTSPGVGDSDGAVGVDASFDGVAFHKESDVGAADEDAAGGADSKVLPLQESCDPLKAASCPRGQRCGLDAAGPARCFYVSDNDADSGQPCAASDDGNGCIDGHTCIQGSAPQPRCAKICDATDYTGCPRGESCNVPISSAHNACWPSCDLLTSDGCPIGTCGVFGDATGAVYKGCANYGTLTQGESCDTNSPCARNHSCVYWSAPPWTSGWECLQHCDLDGLAGTPCPDGTTCSYPPNELEPFASIDGVGVCR